MIPPLQLGWAAQLPPLALFQTPLWAWTEKAPAQRLATNVVANISC